MKKSGMEVSGVGLGVEALVDASAIDADGVVPQEARRIVERIDKKNNILRIASIISNLPLPDFNVSFLSGGSASLQRMVFSSRFNSSTEWEEAALVEHDNFRYTVYHYKEMQSFLQEGVITALIQQAKAPKIRAFACCVSRRFDDRLADLFCIPCAETVNEIYSQP